IETPPRAPSPVHRFGTLAVHAGAPHDPVTGAVIEPVSSLIPRRQQWGTKLTPNADITLNNFCANGRGKTRWRIRVQQKRQPEQVSLFSAIGGCGIKADKSQR